MVERHDVWMAPRFLQSASQAAHEWFEETAAIFSIRLMADVIKALAKARPQSNGSFFFVSMTHDEIDALAHACACAVKELTGRSQKTTEDRLYRRGIIDAMGQMLEVLGQLSKNVDRVVPPPAVPAKNVDVPPSVPARTEHREPVTPCVFCHAGEPAHEQDGMTFHVVYGGARPNARMLWVLCEAKPTNGETTAELRSRIRRTEEWGSLMARQRDDQTRSLIELIDGLEIPGKWNAVEEGHALLRAEILRLRGGQ